MLSTLRLKYLILNKLKKAFGLLLQLVRSNYLFVVYLTNVVHPNTHTKLASFNEMLRNIIDELPEEKSRGRLIRAIYKTAETGYFSDSSAEFKRHSCIYPGDPKALIRYASCHYYRGRYFDFLEVTSNGLKLLENQAKNLGFDLLNVRFINGDSWGFNIGHIACLEMLIKLKDLNVLSSEKRIVIAKKSEVPNVCYLNYFADHMDIIYLDDPVYSEFIKFFGCISEYMVLPKGTKGYLPFYSAASLASRSWAERNKSPLLFLKSSDKDHGLEVFRRLGVPKDAWFISVHVREGDDRRCTSNSNATLENYKKAFKVITDRGGWVIRMGHKGMTPLQPMERCIDYANSDYKSESMDVFLWASCLFFIGSSSGPLSVPPTFGRRVLYTNCPCIGQNQFYPGSIFLPKLYWSNTENRLLTFPEMMASSIGWTVSSVFDDFDGSILENTDEEIADAVNEMFTLSELKPDQSLSELQMRFNNLRLRYSDYGQTTISQSFIEKYQSLLS